jgi:hypothetical protein
VLSTSNYDYYYGASVSSTCTETNSPSTSMNPAANSEVHPKIPTPAATPELPDNRPTPEREDSWENVSPVRFNWLCLLLSYFLKCSTLLP